MKRRLIFRIFSYFLCVSFFLQMGEFSRTFAQEKGGNLPIGEMISRGEVKFEAKEKIWKKVELSYFPIFKGSKIKTDKGSAVISLAKDNQIEMGPNTLLLFDQKDQIRFFEGQIIFRIGSPEGLAIKVGNLTVANPPHLQASTSALAPQKNIAAIGAISVHSNDTVTIRSTQGEFSVLNPQGVALASVSPKVSLRIPSSTIQNPPAEKNQKTKFAQVGEITPAADEGTPLGLSGWTWAGIGVGALAVGGGIAIAAGGGGGGGGSSSPVCPP